MRTRKDAAPLVAEAIASRIVMLRGERVAVALCERQRIIDKDLVPPNRAEETAGTFHFSYRCGQLRSSDLKTWSRVSMSLIQTNSPLSARVRSIRYACATF